MTEAEIKTSSRVVLPFKVKDGFELASTAPPTIPCLVDGLLIKVGTSILSADPKCGKSSLAREAMVAVVEGRNFLGFRTFWNVS
jgi:RecA-family ATPase